MLLDIEDYKAHFSKNISMEAQKYAEDHLFSHYIFLEGSGRQKNGYCTYCKQEFKISGVKHKETWVCPKCGRKCSVRSSGMGRSQLIDQVYFVYYEKSILNPKTIVARGIHAARDYRGDYRNVKTQMVNRTLYVFEMGGCGMLKCYTWFSETKGVLSAGGYDKCRTVFSEFNHFWQKTNFIIGKSKTSIKKAVKGTPFQYSTWENYFDNSDMTNFFGLYSKYPCIEYLTKLGFERCVDAKLCNKYTYGAVNWNGNTILKVLRLNKNDVNILKATNVMLDPCFLRLYQLSKRDGSNLSSLELCDIKDAFSNTYYKHWQAVLKHTTLRKAFTYIKNQYDASNKAKGETRFYSINDTLINFKDYLYDCAVLEMDLKSDSVLYPKDLYRAHQNTIKQVKLNADEHLNKKILKRVGLLCEKFYFECNGLLIRPAMSTNELIAEGKALHHCVGTYADRYAKGSTNILLIRKATELDKPYYTMEITKDNRILQTRGKNNCAVNSEVSQFVTAFRDEKLNEPVETKVRIMVPA